MTQPPKNVAPCRDANFLTLPYNTDKHTKREHTFLPKGKRYTYPMITMVVLCYSVYVAFVIIAQFKQIVNRIAEKTCRSMQKNNSFKKRRLVNAKRAGKKKQYLVINTISCALVCSNCKHRIK